MATLQVLCPNGRRQNVKITPNSKLLQVLEEVCQKQGFIPTEDYKLAHGRKDLDLSLSVRYSNLPNNAKLELHKLEKSRAEESVGIALQLESGQRLQHSFPPGTLLWDVLQYWESQNVELQGKLMRVDDSVVPPVHPVCIYMREEVIGKCALQSTSLRKLALTGGRAVLRLVHRPVEDSAIAEIIGKIEREKVKEARLGDLASRKHAEMLVDNMAAASPSERGIKPVGEEVTPMEADNCDGRDNSAVSRSASGAEAMDVDNGNSVQSTKDTNTTAIERRDPARSQQAAVPRDQSAIEQLRGLNIPGVEVFTPDDFNDLTPEEQQMARTLARRMMRHLMGDSAPPANQTAPRPTPRPALPSVSSQSFADFKFPESSKGQTLYSNEMSDVKPEEYRPCDRKAVLFSMEEPVPSAPTAMEEDLPDDFFEHTESDLQRLMSDLQKNVDGGLDAPLMTQAMRRSQLEERYSCYRQVVIRVQFPDKLVLQGLFRPRETVFAVQKFVKEHLDDKSASFYLYTSPPKCVLKDKTMTLIEALLVPATRIYFGCDVSKDHYLSAAVRTEISPRSKAEEIAFDSLPDNDETASSSDHSSDSQKPRSKVQSSGSSSGQGSGKAPKWLKLGKK